MTYAPGPAANPQSELLAERFAASGYAGNFGLGTYRAYAIVQVWAQAVEQAGTFAPDAVAEALRSSQFDTVLGRIGFDQKGLQHLCLVRLAGRRIRAAQRNVPGQLICRPPRCRKVAGGAARRAG